MTFTILEKEKDEEKRAKGQAQKSHDDKAASKKEEVNAVTNNQTESRTQSSIPGADLGTATPVPGSSVYDS